MQNRVMDSRYDSRRWVALRRDGSRLRQFETLPLACSTASARDLS
jgi:hypothetical protein